MDLVIGDGSKHEGASDAYFWAKLLDGEDAGLIHVPAEQGTEEGWGDEEDDGWGESPPVKGGPGSGYHSPHLGRQGERGGSAPRDGSAADDSAGSSTNGTNGSGGGARDGRRGVVEQMINDGNEESLHGSSAEETVEALMAWTPNGPVANKDALSRYTLGDADRAAYMSAMTLESPDVKSVMDKMGLTKVDVYRMIADARKKIMDIQQDTKTMYTVNGQYTPERQVLHQRLIDEALANSQPVPDGEEPTLLMTGGVPGSGKSSILGTPDYAERVKNYVALDSDELKGKLAAADGINNVTWEAAMYHEESSDVLEAIMKQATMSRRNILFDATMKSTGKFYTLIGEAEKLHYKTEIAYADLPLEKAIGRAIARFLRGGRFVDPAYVASNDSKNIKSFEELRGMVDVAKHWNTDVPYGQPARLVG